MASPAVQERLAECLFYHQSAFIIGPLETVNFQIVKNYSLGITASQIYHYSATCGFSEVRECNPSMCEHAEWKDKLKRLV